MPTMIPWPWLTFQPLANIRASMATAPTIHPCQNKSVRNRFPGSFSSLFMELSSGGVLNCSFTCETLPIADASQGIQDTPAGFARQAPRRSGLAPLPSPSAMRIMRKSCGRMGRVSVPTGPSGCRLMRRCVLHSHLFEIGGAGRLAVRQLHPRAPQNCEELCPVWSLKTTESRRASLNPDPSRLRHVQARFGSRPS